MGGQLRLQFCILRYNYGRAPTACSRAKSEACSQSLNNSISVIEPQEAHGFEPRTSVARHSVTSVTSTLNVDVNRKLFENTRQHMWFKFGLGVLVCKMITGEGVGAREQSKLPCFLATSSKIRRSNKKHATPRNGRVAPPLP